MSHWLYTQFFRSQLRIWGANPVDEWGGYTSLRPSLHYFLHASPPSFPHPPPRTPNARCQCFKIAQRCYRTATIIIIIIIAGQLTETVVPVLRRYAEPRLHSCTHAFECQCCFGTLAIWRQIDRLRDRGRTLRRIHSARTRLREILQLLPATSYLRYSIWFRGYRICHHHSPLPLSSRAYIPALYNPQTHPPTPPPDFSRQECNRKQVAKCCEILEKIIASLQ